MLSGGADATETVLQGAHTSQIMHTEGEVEGVFALQTKTKQNTHTHILLWIPKLFYVW